MRMRILLLGVAVTLIAGCVSPERAVRSASPHAVTPASKAEVARYAEQLLIENYKIDGSGAAVIIARGDEVLFRGARGMGDIERTTPLSADAQFNVASITKQFAAAGLLKLVEAGKVSLDDPLSKFFKDYPNGDKITVLELLNHTSGIKDYSDIPGMDDPAQKDRTTAQLIDSFKNAKPDFAPGANWAYDNSGYVLVGALIEAASGMPWHAYLQQALFQPLGLSHTGYAADPAIVARQVHGYTLADGKSAPARLNTMHLTSADGGLVSNVDDLLKWNRALHEGRVLKRDSYRRMITPIGQAVPEQYGFGLWHTTLRNHEMLGHSGWINGFTAYLLYLPQSHTSVVVLQNVDRAPGAPDARAVSRKLAAFAIGEPYLVPTQIAVAAATLQQTEGVYGIDLPGPSNGRTQGARVVRVIDGKLTVARTGDLRSSWMPIAADVFQASDGLDRLRFERDAAGAVTGMRFFSQGEGDGLLLARTNAPPPTAQITLPRAALERVTGIYSANGMEMHVTLDGEHLKAEVIGQPPATALIAESPNKFLVDIVDATVEFTPAEGIPQVVVLHQGGDVVEFKRKP
jgi:CubicO group peptidase (beta-lactamase class C family)